VTIVSTPRGGYERRWFSAREVPASTRRQCGVGGIHRVEWNVISCGGTHVDTDLARAKSFGWKRSFRRRSAQRTKA